MGAREKEDQSFVSPHTEADKCAATNVSNVFFIGCSLIPAASHVMNSSTNSSNILQLCMAIVTGIVMKQGICCGQKPCCC